MKAIKFLGQTLLIIIICGCRTASVTDNIVARPDIYLFSDVEAAKRPHALRPSNPTTERIWYMDLVDETRTVTIYGVPNILRKRLSENDTYTFILKSTYLEKSDILSLPRVEQVESNGKIIYQAQEEWINNTAN
jgi:hypothetical protein